MQNELKYIEMVYQKGSFSKAAQALYLTQPALSLSIQRVEAEIGMQLFDRSKKPLTLTEAGRIYIESIQQQHALERELQNRLLDLTSMKSGNLRIGATSYILSCILPSVLLQYKKRYPGISLDITEAGSYELKEMLWEQKLDVIFLSRLDKKTPFSARPAFRDYLILSVPANFSVNEETASYALTNEDILAGRHLEENCPAVDLSSFRETPFILLEEKYDLRRRAESIFELAGIRPPIYMETAQVITAQTLSQAGIGATFVPDRSVSKWSQGTYFYKLDFPQIVRNMNLVTNNRSYTSLATQHFIEMFCDSYSQGQEP